MPHVFTRTVSDPDQGPASSSHSGHVAAARWSRAELELERDGGMGAWGGGTGRPRPGRAVPSSPSTTGSCRHAGTHLLSLPLQEAAAKNDTSRWVDSTTLLATGTSPEEEAWPTPRGSGAWAPRAASVPPDTLPLSEANQTAVHTQSPQNQCWETYVGQVGPAPMPVGPPNLKRLQVSSRVV